MINRTVLQAIRDEILQALGNKRCYYHYNPTAVITGPILYFDWCSDDQSQLASEIQIFIRDGKIYMTKDPQPIQKPTNVIACFDLAAPDFCVDCIIKTLEEYYTKRKQ